jgi:lipopolysaccharide transport system permease protein
MGSTPVLELSGERTPVRSLVADLVRGRHLVAMLARQDFAARYRSASLGLLWTVALPLLQGAVLAVVFTRVVKVQTDEPYVAFVLVGMAVWAFLNGSLQSASTAVVDGGAIATKIYFPRLVLPAVAPTANLVGFVISTAVGVVVAVVQTGRADARLMLLPAAMALAYLLVLVVGALAALLHVYFRDVRYVVTAVLLVAFYATPVIYPLELAGDLEPYVLANPATGCVQLVRWCVFGSADSLGPALAWTVGWLAVLTVLVLRAYGRHERIACDRL